MNGAKSLVLVKLLLLAAHIALAFMATQCTFGVDLTALRTALQLCTNSTSVSIYSPYSNSV